MPANVMLGFPRDLRRRSQLVASWRGTPVQVIMKGIHEAHAGISVMTPAIASTTYQALH